MFREWDTSPRAMLDLFSFDGRKHWLRGWHAAAEELALIQRQPMRSAKSAGGRPLGRLKPMAKRRQALCCALCGAPVSWHRGQDAQACQACGSKLFRSGNPR